MVFNNFFIIIQILPEIAHTVLLYTVLIVTYVRQRAATSSSGLINSKILGFRLSRFIYLILLLILLAATGLNIPSIFEQDDERTDERT